MKVEIDTKAFDEAFRKYRAARLDKDYPYVAHRALRNVLMRSVPKTPKADPSKIAHAMGQIATVTSIIKKGRRAGQKRVLRLYSFKDTLATRIINARRKKAGQEYLHGQELETAAKKMIAARMRASGFIRSGWLPAIKRLRSLTKQAEMPRDAGRIYGQEKGYLVPAKIGKVFSATEAGNSAKASGRVGQQALEAALAEVATDMLAWAIPRLRESARLSGFKVA